MTSREPAPESRQRDVDRQTRACLGIFVLGWCMLAIVFALLARSLVPLMYSSIATQVAGFITPTVTPHPPRPTVIPDPTSTPLPGYIPHRIGVRMVDDVGEFYDRLTGEKFVPRGYNYARFSPIFGASGQLWEETLGPGFYDPVAADRALEQMHANGYNVVRVAIDCCRPSSNVGSRSGGISSAYMDNVFDFLNKAKANEIYVIFALNLTPADGDYNRFWNNDPKIFDAANLRYLTAGGFKSKQLYDQDFIRALITRNAPLDAVFAYDLTDSVGYDEDRPPLTLQSGRVSTVNRKTYDMANPEDKQKMLNENLIYWIDQQRAAILKVDPTALVTASFHAFTAKSSVSAAYANMALWESTADFFDLHIYIGTGLTLDNYVNNFGINGMTEKPIIMGQFMAWPTGFSSSVSAARALQKWQIASCQVGFDGWVLWLPSQENSRGVWSGAWDENIINDRLAPINRPEPCRN